MDKQTRTRITWGVWATIIGLIIAFVLRPIVAQMTAPDPAELLSGFGQGDMFAAIEKVQSTSNLLSIMFFGGLAIALLGVLYTAIVWTQWFTQNDDKQSQDKS